MAVRRILTLAALGAISSAHASPRSDPTVGRAVFTGATVPHPTSIDLDPAAIGLSPVDEIYLAIAGMIDQLHIDLDQPGARVRDVELAPAAMFAVIYHLAGEAITLGFEAHSTAPEVFPANRSALRYHALGGGERDWLVTAAASFKVSNELFFGASLSHQNTFLRLDYARDTALERGHLAGGIDSPCGGAPCGVANPLATETYNIDVRSPWLSTSNLKVNIGALVQIAHDVWLGVGYHTPPGFAVQTELAGHVGIDRAPRDVAPDGPSRITGESVAEIQLPASVDAELRARLPYKLDLHLAGRWEDLSRLQAYDVRTFGSTLPRLGIPEWTERPRGMHDSFAVWGGVEQVDNGQTLLFGGRVGIETSSVSDRRTSPITIAPTSFTLDGGAQLRASHLILQLSYGVQYFPTVNTRSDSAFNPVDRIACIDSNYNYALPACEAVRDGYAIPSAAGEYTRIEHALRLGLRYEFQ